MNESIVPTGAEHPVQKQLDAYNARDIDAFMEWWSDDCEYYEFPARLLASGAAQIRGKLIRRSVVDNLVVDQEVVTRTLADGIGEVDVLAIYQIENGKIAKAWFKMGSPRLAPNAN
jgi:hypothetical protein